MKISLILPFRERLDLFRNLLKTLSQNTSNPNDVEILCAIDMDDPVLSWDVVQDLEIDYADFSLKFYSFPRSDNFVQQYYNPLARLAKGRWIMAINDDCGFVTPSWDKTIIERMDYASSRLGDDFLYGMPHDGEGTYYQSDGIKEFSCWGILSKQYVDAMGWYYHPKCWLWGSDQVCGQIFYVYGCMYGEQRRVNIPEVEIKTNHLYGNEHKDSRNRERFCRIHDEHNVELTFEDLVPEAVRLNSYITEKRKNEKSVDFDAVDTVA